MCDCDSVRTDFFRHSERTSRKPHECVECRKVIKPGEKYHYYVGKASNWAYPNGYFWHCGVCTGCGEDWSRILDVFYKNHDQRCQCFGELEKVVAEAVDLGYLEETDPLAVTWLGLPTFEEESGDFPPADDQTLLLPFPE